MYGQIKAGNFDQVQGEIRGKSGNFDKDQGKIREFHFTFTMGTSDTVTVRYLANIPHIHITIRNLGIAMIASGPILWVFFKSTKGSWK